MEGAIVRLVVQKQFGFIRGKDNVERFFHKSAVENKDFSELREGQRVTFTHTKGHKGPRAEAVQVLD
jgi:CspA family cold shock protein